MTYVTAGAGHRRAAEAIAEALAERLPDAQVMCVDALCYMPAWFRRAYSATYLLLVRRFAWVWQFSYARVDGRWVFSLVSMAF